MAFEAEHDFRTWIPGVFPSFSDKTTTVSFQLTGTAKKGPELCQKLDLLWCRQLSLPPMLPTELSVGLLGRMILGSQIWKGLAVFLWVDEHISELAVKMVRNHLPLWLKAFPETNQLKSHLLLQSRCPPTIISWCIPPWPSWLLYLPQILVNQVTSQLSYLGGPHLVVKGPPFGWITNPLGGPGLRCPWLRQCFSRWGSPWLGLQAEGSSMIFTSYFQVSNYFSFCWGDFSSI